MLDYNWVNERLAVGGEVNGREEMDTLRKAGVTHVINLQAESPPLADPEGTDGIEVLWLPIYDDFLPKPPDVFKRGVEFALDALSRPGTKVLVHCAAGVHRGPMMMYAILRALGLPETQAQEIIKRARPQANFLQVYVESVEEFIRDWSACA